MESIELPCGVMEEGEDPMTAAQRELLEETGYAGGEWSKLMSREEVKALLDNDQLCQALMIAPLYKYFSR